MDVKTGLEVAARAELEGRWVEALEIYKHLDHTLITNHKDFFPVSIILHVVRSRQLRITEVLTN